MNAISHEREGGTTFERQWFARVQAHPHSKRVVYALMWTRDVTIE